MIFFIIPGGLFQVIIIDQVQLVVIPLSQVFFDHLVVILALARVFRVIDQKGPVRLLEHKLLVFPELPAALVGSF